MYTLLDFRRYTIVHDLLRESTVFLGVKSGGLLIEFFGRTGENIEQVRSHWPRAWSCCTWVGSVVSTLCNFSSKSLSKSKFFIKALHEEKILSRWIQLHSIDNQHSTPVRNYWQHLVFCQHSFKIPQSYELQNWIWSLYIHVAINIRNVMGIAKQSMHIFSYRNQKWKHWQMLVHRPP